MSSPASYPMAAGPSGKTAGRATSGDRAVKAPGVRLKPASEAECHGAHPKEVRGAQRGADESEMGER